MKPLFYFYERMAYIVKHENHGSSNYYVGARSDVSDWNLFACVENIEGDTAVCTIHIDIMDAYKHPYKSWESLANGRVCGIKGNGYVLTCDGANYLFASSNSNDHLALSIPVYKFCIQFASLINDMHKLHLIKMKQIYVANGVLENHAPIPLENENKRMVDNDCNVYIGSFKNEDKETLRFTVCKSNHYNVEVKTTFGKTNETDWEDFLVGDANLGCLTYQKNAIQAQSTMGSTAILCEFRKDVRPALNKKVF